MCAMPMEKRVIFYVDGFNLYYGLKSKKWKKFYWLDIVSFFEKFLKHYQVLAEVNYFSAIPISRGKQKRQELFFSANKLNPKFNLFLGKYVDKPITCNSCGNTFTSYEEKQTDVHIATKMIRDIVMNKCDISILISADSDLLPPIDFIREFKPNHKIFVYFPPNRFSIDLKNRTNKYIKLENHIQKFQTSMLKDEIKLPNGYIIERPSKWN